MSESKQEQVQLSAYDVLCGAVAYVCDELCKWPEKCEEQIKDPDEAYDYCLNHYCEGCKFSNMMGV